MGLCVFIQKCLQILYIYELANLSIVPEAHTYVFIEEFIKPYLILNKKMLDLIDAFSFFTFSIFKQMYININANVVRNDK